MSIPGLSVFTGLFALAAAASISAGADRDGARVPVLLELFTSEGCSSCPPADRLLETFDQKQPVPGADLIVLSEHVDYWNQLGWKDPFSSQFSARQHEFASKLRSDDIYTPQLVVDGRFGFVGSDEHEAWSAIRKAIREPKIAISISNVAHDGNQVSARVTWPATVSAKFGKAVLYVAIADNRADSHVTRGENSGRNLAHAGVARVLKQVDTISLDSGASREVMLAVPPVAGSNGMRLVVFIQDAISGRVLGVAAQKL